MEALRARFRPEFLNRIDEFVTFNSLGLEQLVPIVAIELDKVSKRLSDRQLSLSVTDAAKQWLAEIGYDASYGARPLKRTIQREIETPISKVILAGRAPPNNVVVIDKRPGEEKLTISIVPDVLDVAPLTEVTSSSTSAPNLTTDDENIMQ